MSDGGTLRIFGGHGGHGGHSVDTSGSAAAPNQSLLASALITNRDGIIGRWRAPRDDEWPTQLGIEEIGNLGRWSPDRRAQMMDFEIGSRLAFSADDEKANPRRVMVWHAATTAVDPPTSKYHPLVRLWRPIDDVFRKQIAQVAYYADLRGDRVAEILAQIDGGLPFFSSILYMSPARTPYTLELLDAVFRSVQMVEMRVKHALASRRPVEYSSQIQPLVETPAHSSFPSGHSTESFAYAIVLIRLLSDLPKPKVRNVELLRQAARIAINRQVAGLHFPIDSAAGALLGLALGEYLVRRFTQQTDYCAWRFRGDQLRPDPDFQFEWDDLFDVDGDGGKGAQIRGAYVEPESPGNPFGLGAASPILEWLWGKAWSEWDHPKTAHPVGR